MLEDTGPALQQRMWISGTELSALKIHLCFLHSGRHLLINFYLFALKS